LQLDDDYAEHHFVPLSAVYERMYVIQPGKSYELQCKYQRQAIRRTLGRMHGEGLVEALALAWTTVSDAGWVDWFGGGRRERSSDDYARRYGCKTPNWKMVSLTSGGIALAHLIERESAA
jgi:hypothetical protein